MRQEEEKKKRLYSEINPNISTINVIDAMTEQLIEIGIHLFLSLMIMATKGNFIY